ncbi:MAG: DUF4395 domain-containing protein, partial [Thiovulaceae bacterium]|nr:DUF4395 domain-containing protein [Sulfurimonadaceae bacterium]
FLFLDFYMRIFCQKYFSIIYISSKVIKRILYLKDKLSDDGAKKLAGLFGIFFVALLIMLNHMDYREFSLIIGVVFIICSSLDAFLDYCVGCKVYFVIKKIYPNFMS